MPEPVLATETAVQHVAGVLSTFCGSQDGRPQVCAHDHMNEARALVKMVEEFHFPDLLRQLVRAFDEHPTASMLYLIEQKLEDLEARRDHVEPR